MQAVQSQYEALPYPPRDPADEAQRLLRTWLDDLPMINHYGYAGRRDYSTGFRVLVAGGGTGDATIFLAEQLRATDAEVVHLDFSGASLGIAQARAAKRGLTNILWVEDSLLNLPVLGLGRFDYINCVGVLHHLVDPDHGLKCLLGVLKDDGVLGLMVYARHGRAGVYQMQALLREVTAGCTDPKEKIALTREVLAAVPRGNWFKRGEDLYHDHRDTDAGLYDLLLHQQDRAYSVEELYAWLADGHGLHLELTDVQRGRAAYLPRFRMGSRPPALQADVLALPARQQYAIAELFAGDILTHSFFATPTPRAAPYGDAEYVPFYFHEPIDGPLMETVFNSNRGRPFVLDHAHSKTSLLVDPGRFGPAILRRIDGVKSFGEIFADVRASVPAAAQMSDEALFVDFRDCWDALHALDRLLLRHRSVPA